MYTPKDNPKLAEACQNGDVESILRVLKEQDLTVQVVVETVDDLAVMRGWIRLDDAGVWSIKRFYQPGWIYACGHENLVQIGLPGQFTIQDKLRIIWKHPDHRRLVVIAALRRFGVPPPRLELGAGGSVTITGGRGGSGAGAITLTGGSP